MNYFGHDKDARLTDAARLIEGGDKKQARFILREIINADPGNVTAWELLLGACFTPQEEVICLQKILALNPHHPWAGERLKRASAAVAWQASTSKLAANKKKKDRHQNNLLPMVAAFLGLFLLICVGIWGTAIFRNRLQPQSQTALQASPTAAAVLPIDTPIANETCETLIQKAIEASGKSCDRLGPNTACYGNNTVSAELISGATQKFIERGDIISVDQLNKLSAAPLNLDAQQWGIVIFKVMANLPRSLPGETVTMVAFGNTSIENGGDNLQTFFFSSQLGQVICEQAPRDGIVINTPKGVSVKFNINGSELTLAGNASLQATKGGDMQVSLYEGTAKIVSNGQEQTFGAGQKVSVQLGGANGLTSTSAPSEPQSLAPADLQAACVITGNLCGTQTVPTMDPTLIAGTLAAELGFTATPTLTFTPAPTDTPSITPTPSETPSPSPTPSPTPTPTRTRTPRPRPTRTDTPAPPQPTNLPPATATMIAPSQTSTATIVAATLTPSPTVLVPCSDVSAGVLTSPGGNDLQITITNNHGSVITLTSLNVGWIQSPPSQAIQSILLNGVPAWSGTEPLPPSDFPAERPWDPPASARLIPAGTSVTLAVQFNDVLQATGYSVQAIFDISCDISGSK